MFDQVGHMNMFMPPFDLSRTQLEKVFNRWEGQMNCNLRVSIMFPLFKIHRGWLQKMLLWPNSGCASQLARA